MFHTFSRLAKKRDWPIVGSARIEDPSFRSREFRRSGPQALLKSRLSKTSLTSCTVKGIVVDAHGTQ